MYNIHRPHRTPSIIKHPLLIQIHKPPGKFLRQLPNNKAHHTPRIIPMSSKSPLRQIIQMHRIQDVEVLQLAIEVVK